jgi:hypothetical protein
VIILTCSGSLVRIVCTTTSIIEKRFLPRFLAGNPPCNLALAVAFARYAGAVVAVDPEAEMLVAARAAAATSEAKIEFIEASSADIGPAWGNFRLAAIGRAFHWMDRAETSRRLDGVIELDGAVVLFGDEHLDVPENKWNADYRALLESYAQRDAARELRKSPNYLRTEAFLLDSAFHQLERIGAIYRRRIPVERLVDRALSMSSTSPAWLGAKIEELAAKFASSLSAMRRVGSGTDRQTSVSNSADSGPSCPMSKCQ